MALRTTSSQVMWRQNHGFLLFDRMLSTIWWRHCKSDIITSEIRNKKSYNVSKRDNGRCCWMCIRRIIIFCTCWVGVPGISVLDRFKNMRPFSVQRKTYEIPSKQFKFPNFKRAPPRPHHPPPPHTPPTARTSYHHQWLCITHLGGGGIRGKGAGIWSYSW